jgi:putative peptidoglycan lipid II flippase
MFFILRAQFVRVTLARGVFIGEAVTLTAAALGAFSMGIFAYALLPVVSKAFFAKEDTKTPLITNVAGIVVSVVLAVLLVYVIFPANGFSEFLAHIFKAASAEDVAIIGLPLSVSIGGIVSLLLLFLAFFKKKENRAILPEILFAFIRIPAVSILAGLAAWSTLHIFAHFFPLSITLEYNIRISFYWIAQASAAGLVGAVVYLFFAYFFKFEEFNILMSFVRAKLKKALPPKKTHSIHHEDISSAG